MKKTNEKLGNKDLLQKFASKNQKKKVEYGNKAVVYNRCSTEKQDSLEWQENVCVKFCLQKE